MNDKQLFAATVDTTIMLRDHPQVLKFQVIGSTLIEGVEAKDLDFLVLADARAFLPTGDCAEPSHVARWLFGPDWDCPAGEYDEQEDSVWGSLRRGDVNLIVTVKPEWYEGAALANEVCVALGLKEKADRIVTYRVVRDGQSAEVANSKRDGSQ